MMFHQVTLLKLQHFHFVWENTWAVFFVAAKNKATDKYKQVTSGINQSIEDEEARRLCELQMMLDSQAEEYEAIIDDVQRTWLKRTTFI